MNKVKAWVEANPSILEWFKKKLQDSKNTAFSYASYLGLYWFEHLSPRGFRNISQWVEEVKEQHQSPEVKSKRRWASELEGWLLSKKFAKATRIVVVAAVRSFLSEQVELSKYDFTFAPKEQIIAERKAREEILPLESEEIRRLVMEASTRDKAVILCQLSGGLGVGEFIQFAGEWHKYAEPVRPEKIPWESDTKPSLRLKDVPVKISLVRPKTGVGYFTYLWDDAVNALNDLMQERERVLERSLTKEDKLFVDKNGRPLKEEDIQEQIRLLADRTGLERRVKGKRVYRIRPHELRDTFKTWCENNEVSDTISEFLLGHLVDQYEYNKFSKTKEGEERIRRDLLKVRPRLNVISGRGTITEGRTSAFEENLDTICIAKGLDPEKVKVQVLYFITKLPGFDKQVIKAIEAGKIRMEGVPEEVVQAMKESPASAIEVAKVMSREELRPAFIAWVQSTKEEPPTEKKPIFKLVDVDNGELKEAFDTGWDFVSVANAHKAIVKKLPD